MATMLIFQMRSSDPDFPFDIEALDCILCVPFDYSESGKPSLTVKIPIWSEAIKSMSRGDSMR